ncbi:HSP90 domain-containing protein [Tribonema minus]|uniref:HSP90 domain-containing protein n=1 Tax=Tribonema minus TaxID=303371 RepID=A0A836CH02_9STRA|nr:HSP90 domain-containing protein [Tribonema minus]
MLQAGVRAACRTAIRRSSSGVSGHQRCLTHICAATTPQRSQHTPFSHIAVHGPAQPFGKSAAVAHLQQSRSLSSDAAETSAPKTGERHEFQAETRQLLDIVTHSIYTDKEVFLRELISNASDAMEKLRHLQVMGEALEGEGAPFEIQIAVDEKAKTLTIQDAGIGMTRDELVSNLGTIARSGSKAFVNELKEKGDTGAGDAMKDIIGQFGVGFYSAFMVGSKVDVYSRSARGGDATLWSSDGSGQFTVTTLDPAEAGLERGSKIVIHLREGCEEYATTARVQAIIKKYSNFVGAPIKLNDKTVNTVEAIWMKAPNEVQEKQYEEFYQFLAHAFDSPLAHLHFRTDAPIDLKVLLFFPTFHTEKFGMGRMEPGVSLYSRKVLIEHKSKTLLPDWLRFVKGVVDSEDLPLSLSREKPQDTALVRKIGDVLVRKAIRFLQDMQKKQTDKYKTQFYPEFGHFLKEGICQDFKHQPELAKLLYFETSKGKPGELCSLDEYVARMAPDSKEIYYLCAPNRKLAESSPYFEAFKAKDREIIFVYSTIDDFVMVNLKEYNGRPIVTAEKDDLDISADSSAEAAEGAGLSEQQVAEVCKFITDLLPDRVSEVRSTNRLADSPAIVASSESGSLRRMMRYLETQSTGKESSLPKQRLEINPRHPIIIGMARIRKAQPEMAKLIAEQVFDNALITAGLLDDSQTVVPRVNKLMEQVLAGSTMSSAEDSVQSTDAPAADVASSSSTSSVDAEAVAEKKE